MIRRLAIGAFCVLAIAWLTHNIRPIPPGYQAVVSRFGAITRVQQSGIVLAWPPPLEHVLVMRPGERQMLQNTKEIDQTITALTADGNLVDLHASLIYSTTETNSTPLAPLLAATWQNAAATEVASHNLQDILAPQPNATLHAIDAATTQNLATLARTTNDPERLRLTIAVAATLPRAAQPTAAEAETLKAEADLLSARKEAAQRLQKTDQARAALFANAHTEAAARLAAARSFAATIIALDSRMTALSRPAFLTDLYRTRIAPILHQAGTLTTIDPKSISKVIIPDTAP